MTVDGQLNEKPIEYEMKTGAYGRYVGCREFLLWIFFDENVRRNVINLIECVVVIKNSKGVVVFRIWCIIRGLVVVEDPWRRTLRG